MLHPSILPGTRSDDELSLLSPDLFVMGFTFRLRRQGAGVLQYLCLGFSPRKETCRKAPRQLDRVGCKKGPSQSRAQAGGG